MAEPLKPVAWVPRAIKTTLRAKVGEYEWDDLYTRPFAINTDCWELVPLYTATPAPQALTDEREALRRLVRAYDHHQDNVRAGLGVVSGGNLYRAVEDARAILAAGHAPGEHP